MVFLNTTNVLEGSLSAFPADMCSATTNMLSFASQCVVLSVRTPLLVVLSNKVLFSGVTASCTCPASPVQIVAHVEDRIAQLACMQMVTIQDAAFVMQ
jgi:hypothetical protein